ncbi:MAG: class I SAM-dependent rRNA methyltransferase [Planctomycetes bacterium]|nr:class I SAM-dependent rRNA methyltransferase [Planctomycetota bacterium]
MPPTAPAGPRPDISGAAKVYLRSAGYGAFVFEKMIDRVEGQPADGDVVAVIDKRGEFFGWGFYNSQSRIRLRMFSHAGPRPDDAAIARRISAAVALRRDMLKLDGRTDTYRLVHAEGDGLSGLVADRFGQYVVLEIFSLAMFRRLQAIQDAFIDAGLSVREFIVRADKDACRQDGFDLGRMHDSKQRDVTVSENGVKFQVDLKRGHKTGFFCDQRENRLAHCAFTPGNRVLDVCCYTGGFACYAAKLGRAAAVQAVDLDENAIEIAKHNATLNGANIEFKHADAFDFLRQSGAQGKKWDVVVVDPSKFVTRRDALEVGLRKYADLNRLASGVVSPGGLLLTCSCSGLVDQPTFIQTVGRAVRAAGRAARVINVTGAGPDHPVMSDTPQSAYLKAVWALME